MRFLEGISFQRKHETVLDSAHVTPRCEHSLPFASNSSHFQLMFLFSSSSFVSILLFTFFPHSKFASDLYSRSSYFESWLGHGLSWLRFFQVFLSSFRQILGKYLLTVSFHVLSSSLITIIQPFEDIQSLTPSLNKPQSTTFPSPSFTFFYPLLLVPREYGISW